MALSSHKVRERRALSAHAAGHLYGRLQAKDRAFLLGYIITMANDEHSIVRVAVVSALASIVSGTLKQASEGAEGGGEDSAAKGESRQLAGLFLVSLQPPLFCFIRFMPCSAAFGISLLMPLMEWLRKHCSPSFPKWYVSLCLLCRTATMIAYCLATQIALAHRNHCLWSHLLPTLMAALHSSMSSPSGNSQDVIAQGLEIAGTFKTQDTHSDTTAKEAFQLPAASPPKPRTLLAANKVFCQRVCQALCVAAESLPQFVREEQPRVVIVDSGGNPVQAGEEGKVESETEQEEGPAKEATPSSRVLYTLVLPEGSKGQRDETKDIEETGSRPGSILEATLSCCAAIEETVFSSADDDEEASRVQERRRITGVEALGLLSGLKSRDGKPVIGRAKVEWPTLQWIVRNIVCELIVVCSPCWC